MSNRRPTEPPLYSRATGAQARSPSERLEPTRPLARSRSRAGRRYSNREPGRSSGLFRVVSGMFTLLLLMMAILGAVALMLQTWVNAPGPLTASKAVVIPRARASSTSPRASSARRDHGPPAVHGRLHITTAGGRRLHSGRQLRIPGRSIRNVIDIISEGRTITHRVTIPEGLTSHQIVERLNADPNLTGEITEVPPEGTLLPETFILQRGAQRQTVIDNLRAESRKLMEKLWAQRQKGLPFKTWEEAVVLASIVEKETGRNDERERVAAVFVNRLRQNMRLQSDPTILYGLSAGKTVWNRPIMKSEIVQKTAHNTYQIDGLPPTPICNPGRAAIEAVLNPASTKDLFFVADGNGGHIFSETLKDHNANVQKWRALERENKEKDGKEEAKDVEAKDKVAQDKDGKDNKGAKAKTAAPGPTPPPRKAPDKAAPAKTPEKSNPSKTPEKASKGAAAPPVVAKPAPSRQEGSWTSTTEPSAQRNLP
jgi:UPF0755 protein